VRERETVRILLIAPSGRILLIRYEDPRIAYSPIFWSTPGGGVDPGESLGEALRRELLEETGMTDVRWGPEVWYGEPVVNISGERVQFRDHYFVAHGASETLRNDGWTDLERSVIREMRWWAPEDLRGAQEVIYPREIADLLPDVIAGRYPSAPITLARR
jgi:8-oxo-dGTP pyrophosphatase MutT (NUDIX family)